MHKNCITKEMGNPRCPLATHLSFTPIQRAWQGIIQVPLTATATAVTTTFRLLISVSYSKNWTPWGMMHLGRQLPSRQGDNLVT